MLKKYSDSLLKAALINIFTLTTDKIPMYNVQGVAHSEQPTENYRNSTEHFSVSDNGAAILRW